jgi:hypothetical protein
MFPLAMEGKSVAGKAGSKHEFNSTNGVRAYVCHAMLS